MLHRLASPQGPIKPASCTYTATPCEPFNGPVETITVYEQPFTVTSTRTYDCHGCTAVAVSSKNCDGVGIVSLPYQRLWLYLLILCLVADPDNNL